MIAQYYRHTNSTYISSVQQSDGAICFSFGPLLACVFCIEPVISQLHKQYLQYHWSNLIGTANAEVIMIRRSWGRDLIKHFFPNVYRRSFFSSHSALACEPQTYYRSSLHSLRKIIITIIVIFRRERSDDRKYVCGSQASSALRTRQCFEKNEKKK